MASTSRNGDDTRAKLTDILDVASGATGGAADALRGDSYVPSLLPSIDWTPVLWGGAILVVGGIAWRVTR